MKHRVGILADDITGGNDIGVMMAKKGYRAGVFSLKRQPCFSTALWTELDCVVLDLDCRLDTPQRASEKTCQAMKLLSPLGCDVLCGKTCSVFRGNVGAHLETMRMQLGGCGMVVVGFPKNGRTTLHGEHYVNGVPLRQTMFANDPIHPMQENSLLKILAKQSGRRVNSYPLEWLDLEAQERKTHLARLRLESDFIIFDVRDQRDLRILAQMLSDEPFICGSSALWEELPDAWGDASPQVTASCDWQDDTGVLLAAGSLTLPTKNQVAYLLKNGVQGFCLPTWELFDDARREQIMEELTASLSVCISRGQDALLYTAQEAAQVALTKEQGYQQGMDDSAVGRCVSATLSAVCRGVLEATHARKLVVAGGDTSAAVSERIGVDEMRILDEIEPGVPVMLGRGRRLQELLLVYKSGSFGSQVFLQKSAELLRRLAQTKQARG